jgi:hypothetical protein
MMTAAQRRATASALILVAVTRVVLAAADAVTMSDARWWDAIRWNPFARVTLNASLVALVALFLINPLLKDEYHNSLVLERNVALGAVISGLLLGLAAVPMAWTQMTGSATNVLLALSIGGTNALLGAVTAWAGVHLLRSRMERVHEEIRW